MSAEVMRIAGALLIVLCGTLSGNIASAGLKSKIRLMGEYTEFLTRTQAVIGFTADDAASLLAGMKGFELMRPVLEGSLAMLKNGVSFEKAWRTAVERNISAGQERELICSFGDGFGTSDVSGELSKLSLHRENAARRHRELLEEQKTKNRLYRTLGTFCGVMAAVVLL